MKIPPPVLTFPVFPARFFCGLTRRKTPWRRFLSHISECVPNMRLACVRPFFQETQTQTAGGLFRAAGRYSYTSAHFSSKVFSGPDRAPPAPTYCAGNLRLVRFPNFRGNRPPLTTHDFPSLLSPLNSAKFKLLPLCRTRRRRRQKQDWRG